MYSFKKSSLEFTEKSVVMDYEGEHCELLWDDVNYIIIGKFTVSFIPKEETNRIITTRIEYKDKILKMLKKYKKEQLLVQERRG